jgi:hypothetical protein
MQPIAAQSEQDNVHRVGLHPGTALYLLHNTVHRRPAARSYGVSSQTISRTIDERARRGMSQAQRQPQVA